MTHPEREDGQRRRAALLLLPLFLVGASLCLWSLFANVTLGEAESFIAAPLHSSALANYGQDPLGGRLQNLSIRIIEFAIRDREPEAGDAGARATEVIEGMKSPVPTVTPKPGDPTATPPPTRTQIPHTLVPATGTPTSTSTPVPTRTPSASPTDPSTADPIATPTKTPTPSKTPTESNTATPSSSPTTTKTPTPSNTPTSSSSPTTTKTPTPSNTPTPCKVTPVVYVELPADGTVYGPGSQIEGHAHAWDPDNVNPSNCAPTPEVDGTGIAEVEFQVKWIVTPVPITVHTRTEFVSQYCAFSGSGSCNTVSVNGGVWPNSTPIAPGQYELWARAKDDEGQYSAWDYSTFTIILPPTATPTSLPPTSTFTSLPPSATPTPLPPPATPTPG